MVTGPLDSQMSKRAAFPLMQDMVCALQENQALCVIQDANNSESVRAKFHLPASATVADLYQEVGRIIQCHQDSFNLVLQGSESEPNVLRLNYKTETIKMAGFKVGPDTKNTLVVIPSPDLEQTKSSESPISSGDYDAPAVHPPPPPPPPASTSTSGDFNYPDTIIRQEIAYVGLVNQAMTCYLNSLLQALYMTPEFRNAMYKWEFDGSPSEESKSIPYQLQKLFLNLQTSRKSAVETTELTRSFGWDSWEAWQQHDVQELCRVMFDTLEQKFKNTKQADLINRLYEGKMIDYVKCLECSTEKSRDDTFLDIPLPVRPFGSNVAYGSVEEALRAFVQPETLDGNNQYHCDTCNKKCDAHKGLKFSKFPYLLTLHLKRFDFDFSTSHRIKLNDKVSFPERLNLNSFIAHEKGNEANNDATAEETAVKCDDSCTTDSGSALDDEGCQGIDAVSVPNSHENHHNDYQDDDEGIDVEQQHENEKNRENACESGPYVYELFSIMIHSGSAAGGHYYAYIKDFKDGEWYCFNDQNVARITYDDIRKTYGGGPIRGYYSGAYSSSTNAYMLMYRQIDKERNASAMTVDEFPEHIKELHRRLERQKELEEQRELEDQKEVDDQKELYFDLITRKNDFHLCKLKVHCRVPRQSALEETDVSVQKDCTLGEALKIIYKRLNLVEIIPMERCRLVSYDKVRETIEYSFEGRENDTIEDTCIFLKHRNFLVDTREEDQEFLVYKLGCINTVVVVVNVETEEVIGPFLVSANSSDTVKEYKELLEKQLKERFKETAGMRILMHVALERFSNEPKLLQNDEATLKREGFYVGVKVYVAVTFGADDSDKSPFLFKVHKVIDRFAHVINLHVSLPQADSETLERLNIPLLNQSQTATNGSKQSEEFLLSSRSRGASPNPRDPSPQPLPDPEDEAAGPAGPHSDQSASEDSSLTDSERTIVGDAPGDCLAQLSLNSSPVGSDQNVSFSENEGNECPRRIERFGGRSVSGLHRNDDTETWDGGDRETSSRNANYFFKAEPNTDCTLREKMLEVFVDRRMSQGNFKQCLEPFVGVPVEYFTISRTFGKLSCFDFSKVMESLEIYKDNEKLNVKFGRALKNGEYAGTVFLLTFNSDEPVKYLFEWVIANGTPVSQVKKEILEELKRKCAIEIPYNRCRLRKKWWSIPMRPYLDGTTFENLAGHWELFVQELPGEEPVTSPNQKLLTVRQLCFSTREVKPFEEIVLETRSAAECKEKISEISGIPVEFIETAKAPVSFSCFDSSVLSPHLDVDWNAMTQAGDGSSNIYDKAHVILYRDNRDKSKCFLMKDRKLLKDRRNRLYSPIKERGLKIYLDATPPRKDESDVD